LEALQSPETLDHTSLCLQGIQLVDVLCEVRDKLRVRGQVEQRLIELCLRLDPHLILQLTQFEHVSTVIVGLICLTDYLVRPNKCGVEGRDENLLAQNLSVVNHELDHQLV
jgi:hypothetical protein